MSESNIMQGIIWQGTPAKRERKQDKINRQADRFDVFSGTKKLQKKRILAPAKSVNRFAKKIDRSADRQIENLIFWDTLMARTVIFIENPRLRFPSELSVRLFSPKILIISLWGKNAAEISALYCTVEFLTPLYQSLS